MVSVFHVCGLNSTSPSSLYSYIKIYYEKTIIRLYALFVLNS